MSEPAHQQRHARSIGALPARISSLDELFVSHSSARNVFTESFGHARRLPRLIELGSVERILADMSARVLSLIRTQAYSSKRLREEIANASTDMNTVLNVHGYAARGAGVTL
jgi:hypothetical protein